jgi:ABC-type amino acid transport substrate-binding protein
MADIFISYSQSRHELTAALAHDLEADGFSVWWDTRTLPNERFRDRLNEELDHCAAAIIIWTPESIASDWVLSEADHARRRRRLVNTLHGIAAQQIPKPFDQIQAVRLDNRVAIKAAVRELMAKPTCQAPVPAPVSLPESKAPPARHYRLWATMTAMVVCGAVASVLSGFVPLPSRLGPGPKWQVDSKTFVGEPAKLKWNYQTSERGAKPGIRFELQNGSDNRFTDGYHMYLEPISILGNYGQSIEGINGSRFYRVRAVDPGMHPLSEWSPDITITQFDSAYRRIPAIGKVRVGISDSTYQNMFKWEDKKDLRAMGFEASLVRAIIAELPAATNNRLQPLEPEFIKRPWLELLDMLRSGQADMVIAAISKTKDREEKKEIRFSDTYFCTTQALLYRVSEANHSVRRMLAGKRVGYQDGTTSGRLAEALSQEIKFELKLLPRTEDIIHAVTVGDVDLAITVVPFAAAAERDQRAIGESHIAYKDFTRADFPASFPKDEQFDKYAIAVHRSDADFLRDLNTAITKLKREDKLTHLIETAAREYDEEKNIPQNIRNDGHPLRDRPWECPG